jgi:hypothetical protein
MELVKQASPGNDRIKQPYDGPCMRNTILPVHKHVTEPPLQALVVQSVSMSKISP